MTNNKANHRSRYSLKHRMLPAIAVAIVVTVVTVVVGVWNAALCRTRPIRIEH